LSQEVNCLFDDKERTILCRTPKFDEINNQTLSNLKFPIVCSISITTDGINYSESEEKFKIY